MNKPRLTNLIILVAVLALLGTACGRSEPVTTTLVVEGMHCQSCADAIISALNGVEGVSNATADFSSGVTTALHSPKGISDELLKTTVEDLGYTVVSISR